MFLLGAASRCEQEKKGAAKGENELGSQNELSNLE
jgi:hypothetical protein